MSSAPALRPAPAAFTPDVFARFLAEREPSAEWWTLRQRDAFARFAALPMPGRLDEAWRFSHVAGLGLAGFDPLVPWPSPAPAAPVSGNFGAPAAELVFGNGRLLSRRISDPTLSARGVRVLTLDEAAASHREHFGAHFLAQPQKLGSEKFAALHAAFVRGGAYIHVPRGVEVAGPIVLTHLAAGPEAAIFPHTLVLADELAAVTVIEHFASADAHRHFACGANDLYAGHGARVTYVGTQRWSEPSLSLQLNSTVVRRDARVQSLNLHLGARQARHESLSQLQAPGAFSEMLALTLAGATQEFDQRTLQIHQAPNTRSDLLYKNALRGRARTIFSGLIVVDPDAQKTDAYQSNRNLMLSDEAEANSLPGLEIQANDVRCTHGATSTRIDPEQEFYLRARGIPRAAADELLTFGFFEETLLRLEAEPIRDGLRELLHGKFAEASPAAS